GGMAAAFGSGVDKVQELGYRAIKGLTDVTDYAAVASERTTRLDPYASKSKISDEVNKSENAEKAANSFLKERIDTNVEQQKDYAPTVKSYKDIDSLGKFGSYAGELVAGSIPYMAAAVTGAGAITLAGGLSQEAYEKQPTDDKNIARAMGSGAGQMLLERLGIKGSLGQVGKDILKDGVIKTAKRYGKGELIDAVQDPRIARRLLKGSLWEGSTELGQEALALWGAGKDFSEFDILAAKNDRGDILGKDGQQLMESFVGGLVVGGVMRSASETAQYAIKWQTKASDVSQKGIDALVEQGMPQEQAIEQVRAQIIESALKQGFDETAAAAIAARTMKEQYDIDSEIFTPIADEIMTEREAWLAQREEKMQANREHSQAQRAKYENQSLQETLGGETAPSVDDLLGDPANNNPINESIDDSDIDLSKSTDDVSPQVVVDSQAIDQTSFTEPVTPEIANLPDILTEQQKSIATASDEVVVTSDENLSTETVDKAVDNSVEALPALAEPNTIEDTVKEAALSPENNLPEPSQAQKDAGNYKMAHIKVNGLDVSIENPKGSNRSGVDSDGQKWSVKMNHHYGYIKGTEGDHVDVFIGDNPNSNEVFIIDQIDPKTKKFDEHKVMIGFNSIEDAENAYLSNYAKDWQGIGNITESPISDFKDWLKNGKTTQAFATIEAEKGVTSNKYDLNYNLDKNTVVGTPDDVVKLAQGKLDIHKKIRLSVIQGKEAVKLGNTLGEDVDGFKHVVDVSAIKHTFKSHGDDKTENMRGQIAVTSDDFYKIGDIINAPDGVKLVGQDKAGKKLLQYKKTFNGTTYYVEEVRNKRQELAFKTMWKTHTRGQIPTENSPPRLTPETLQRQSPTKESVAPTNPLSKIEDFGEVLLGAAKHKYTLSEKLDEEVDIEAEPLSKSFPQPDYEKLAEQGVPVRTLAFIAQLRGEIKTKPRRAGKLERWVEQVADIRDHVKQLLEMGESGADTLIERLGKDTTGEVRYIKYLPHILNIAQDIPPQNIKALGDYKLTHSLYAYYRGEENVHKWVVINTSHKSGFGGMGNMDHFDTVEDAVTYIKEQVTNESIVNGKKITKFDVWTERGEKGIVFVGKKLASRKFIELKQFSNTAQARAYINEHQEELISLLKEKRTVKAHRRPNNNPRIGADYRDGKDASPEMFDEAFGFRGVQFGNWVENHKRINDLNYAYDGLMDLASILNVPPKALSLNGELGLAFGARGRAGAMAHYESGSIVINLTKKMGSGTLAHEWFHALDNYFARVDKLTSGKMGVGAFMTEHQRAFGFHDKTSNSFRESGPNDFNVRKEVYDAFKAIKKSIEQETKMVARAARLDKYRSKDYWGTVREMAARSFERYVIDKLDRQGFESDYLANIVKESSTDASDKLSEYPYPLATEMDAVNKAYDNLFDTLETKDTADGVALFRKEAASTVFSKGSVKPKGMSIADANAIAKEFIDSYNGNLDLTVRVKNTQEEFYGPDATIEKEGIIKGAYHHEGRFFTLAANNLQNRADARATIRHEVLGHYGMQVVRSADRSEIIGQIIASQNGDLKETWAQVKNDYSDKTLDQQAEEVFAFIIENRPSKAIRIYDEIVMWLRQALKAVGLMKHGVSKSELRSLAETISKQIQSSKGDNNGPNLPIDRSGPSFRKQTEQTPLADETKKDLFIRKVQDKFQRLNVIQRSLTVNENNDAYMSEEAFHGKVSEGLRKLEKEHIDVIANTMAKDDLSQDEVDLYLIAKHAKERNEYIDTINPDLKGVGSGMTNEQAQSVLDKAVIEEKYQALEQVTNQVYAMLAQNRDMMMKYGLEAQDAIDTWQAQYQFYVPF
ncbi:MAG: hypothetical protein HRU25_14585, partial [Psychrobium sp.]|nr:hypothetical protein [Psychrobium sp.]